MVICIVNQSMNQTLNKEDTEVEWTQTTDVTSIIRQFDRLPFDFTIA
jgi:hypothetical protein